MKSAVFLDRDGVLTIPEFRDGRSYAPKSLANFNLYPDAEESVKCLKEAGFLVIVVTNQPDIGAGITSQQEVDKMHDYLRSVVAVDDIEVSTETRAQDAMQNEPRRRKPGPGMLLDAASKWSIDLEQSFMVGDRLSDIEAGNAAGCRSIFIDLDYEAEPKPGANTIAFKNLRAATTYIVNEKPIL